MEEAEIDDTTHNNVRIVSACLNSDIIITGPDGSHNELRVGILPRSSATYVCKFNRLVLISRLSSYISKNAQVYIRRNIVELEFGTDVRVALSSTRTLVRKLFKLFGSVSGMIFNIFKSVSANSIEFLENNGSHFSHIVVAPLNLRLFIIRECFTKNILHFTNDIL